MKVLLVGSLFDEKWIGNLIRNLKKSPAIYVDFYHVLTWDGCLSSAAPLCNNVFFAKRHFPGLLYKVPKISHLLSFIDVPLSLNHFLNNKELENYYDVVNIHYPQNKVLRSWKGFKAISRATIVTPWGSEVLRISKCSQRLMASYIAHYDYIMSSDNPRFKGQLQRILSIPETKFLLCDFGSEMIDKLCHSTITKIEAKKHFGVDSQYVIVCGYNGSASQNHLKIIRAIAQIKNKLPKKLIIILPMTYNTSPSYMNKVREELSENHLDCIILNKYLPDSEMVYLRKCADMFIHAQETDANSVSLAEHLICDSIVINASWLRYENRELYGVPYYLFASFEELPRVIETAFRFGAIVPDELKKSISEEGWSIRINKWIDIFKQVSASE